MILICPPGFHPAETNSGQIIYKNNKHCLWVYAGSTYRIYVPADYDRFEEPVSGRMYILSEEEYYKVLAFLELL